MTIISRFVDYNDRNTALQGRVAFDDARPGLRPVVLVAHQWGGRSEFTEGHAERLAQLGYIGFAIDMYGASVRGSTIQECKALMTPFMENRAMLAQRINAGLLAARALRGADVSRVAAIGFCFGGLTVLDLARSGADLRGVVSIHGVLKGNGLPKQAISAKVLVLHGDRDPMAPSEDLDALRRELTDAGADWQAHVYGNTMHGFSDPSANMPDMGIQYNAAAERRSYLATLNFLEEVLG